MSGRLRVLFSVVAVLLAGQTLRPANADVTLPRVFGSHMVLQRDAELPVWGWADKGEQITVSIGDASATATADDRGRWAVALPAMPAGGPHSLKVTGKNAIELTDVLVGEVWVCSGQSNMEWSVSRANNPQEEIAAANWPQVRLFHIPKVPAGTPQTDVNADWKVCSPETIPNFTAVGYFFGRELHRELDVPVGLIESAWGGTRIEPWTPVPGFRSVPAFAAIGDDAIAKRIEHQRRIGDSVKTGRKVPPHPLANRGAPTGLYNGMIHAIVPYAIRGAIWYQGEANRGDRGVYEGKMHALINGWREVWGQGDFPFLFAQLAPYNYGEDTTMLPEVWEAQEKVLAVPNTGMAVTVDIGNPKDIHPRNKQDVGKRLALWALAKTYGQDDIVYSGPLYRSMRVEGSSIRIEFEHAADGLASRDDRPLTWFEIAGEDGQFVPATAKIDGMSVVVSSEQVAKPAHARFGWNQIAEPNLMNKTGLPAGPFRTDRPETSYSRRSGLSVFTGDDYCRERRMLIDAARKRSSESLKDRRKKND